MEKPLRIFCCYARADQAYLLALRNHLMPLQRTGLLTTHADIDISPGENWQQKIRSYLNTAHIILLLVSPDFLASDYCWSSEMTRALERHNEGSAYVIPLILRSCYWANMPFSTIQALPTNTQPITTWPNQDDAFLDVVNGIRRAIENLLSGAGSHQIQTPFPPTQPARSKEHWVAEGAKLFDEERYADALMAYEQAIGLDPADTRAYMGKAKTLGVLKNHKEALAVYEQAIRLDVNNVWAYICKGNCLSSLRRYQEALAAFDQAIALNLDRMTCQVAWSAKSRVFENLGMKNEASTARQMAERI
jgi:tetratricopeptide (TPR) repeat protein